MNAIDKEIKEAWERENLNKKRKDLTYREWCLKNDIDLAIRYEHYMEKSFKKALEFLDGFK